MNSPCSGFDSLAEPIRRWCWQQGWRNLRDIQQRAIPAILHGGDVVLSAGTAAGKTEAAFLPLLTRLLAQGHKRDGFAIIHVSPLKALINDQHRRLEGLCETLQIDLHRWHGDVPASAKNRARERPSGIFLTTPESLEALLVRRGREIPRLFRNLEAVVIDELHALIGCERGVQLQSILTRVERACGRARVDRIGLSATLGDAQLAAEALRPGAGNTVTIVTGTDHSSDVALQIRGYVRPPEEENGDRPAPLVPVDVQSDLISFLRGGKHLLFAGSRRDVEIYTNTLAERCEENNLPNAFFAHHGNLGKAQREELESRLREDPRPTTAVATTTLELGIDVGDVDSIAQIGPGPSVASLRQRLGRSGRRAGTTSTMRMFVIENDFEKSHHPVDHLRLELIQSIAVVECLIENWYEPPARAGLHLSTLLHQILAVISQFGGARPGAAYNILCELGPFRNVDKRLFADMLKQMAGPKARLIEQASDGTLMLGAAGERIVESHEFYAVFVTPDEYRLITRSDTLGTYPIVGTVAPGQTIIFSGRRWKILEIDDRARSILVEPTDVAMPPKFSGTGGCVDDRVVAQMCSVLKRDDVPAYLDAKAKKLLAQARASFDRYGLREQTMLPVDGGAVLFAWVGTKKLETLCLALTAHGYEPSAANHVIEIPKADTATLVRVLRTIAADGVPDGKVLADKVAMPFKEKFDAYLGPDLLKRAVIEERLDLRSLPDVARTLTAPYDSIRLGEG
jgi:ATP-dependent Lhr-like helicase